MKFIKKLIIIATTPIRFLFSNLNIKLIKNLYGNEKTLKHDIKSDLRTRLLNPLHQVFVGFIPQPFKIFNNEITFYSQGSLMSTQAYYVGEIEHHLINYFTTKHIKNDMVFLDIGGHHGAFSVIAAHNLKKLNYNGRIFCFEPSSENREFIDKNVNENDLSEYVKIIPKAVSAVPGLANLSMSFDNSCNWLESEESPSGDYNVTAVETISIDSFCENMERVDVIKIDIQGGELPALRGAINTMAKFKPVMFVEIMDYSEDANTTKDFLNKNGYNLFYLTKESKLVLEGDKNIFISWDVVAIPIQ